MLSLSFEPFPVLHTPRLILRRPVTTDVPDFFEMRSDPQVMQYIPRPLAATHADVEAWLQIVSERTEKTEGINWAVEWKETGKAIGMIGYVNIKPEHDRAEIGYSLIAAWHRKGIMREALKATMDYGFNEMKLHSIEAIIDIENVASGKLLEEAGFVQEAHFREDFFYKGKHRDSVHYGLLRRAFNPAL